MKIMLNGYNGKLGRAVIEAASNKSDEFNIVVGIDINPAAINFTFPVFLKPSDYKEKLDIIIDKDNSLKEGLEGQAAELKKIFDVYYCFGLDEVKALLDTHRK